MLGSVPGLAFAVSANTASGGNWLSAGAASGSTPDLLSITADPSNLVPGSYTGTITIAPAAATPAVPDRDRYFHGGGRAGAATQCRSAQFLLHLSDGAPRVRRL